ncbi:uncharacterized protein [Triticum aestivum]|uniref:uncharacterized protein n=1 Tax=Triticum aestivum TaxID=4565 RepID=UPI001D01C755|nr:uncharacterized protein LOC123125891 [Triticum aestivum]
MARKRKGAGDNTEPRQRRPRVAPPETTAGPQAPAAGDFPGPSSLQGQFALLRGFDPLLGNPGRTATSQALARVSSATVNAQGFGGGLSRGGGLARTTMLRQSLRNAYPDAGSAPFGIHAASGQNQIANSGASSSQFAGGGGGGGSGSGFGGFSQFAGGIHAPTGYGFSGGVIGQPHGNSSGPSSAGLRCSDCNELTTGHLDSVPLCQACYSKRFTVNAGAHQGRIPDPAGRCIVCKNSTRMYWVASMPLCSDCHRKIFASNGPLQHLQPFLAGLRRGGVSQSTPPVGNLAGGILATASGGNQTGAAQPHGNSGGTRYVPSCVAARQGQQAPDLDLDLRLSQPSSKACIYNHRSDEVCSYCYRGSS